MNKILLLFVFVFITKSLLYAQITVWYDDFEIDRNWTFSGEFERGIPQGLGGNSYDYSDPASAYAGSYVIGTVLGGTGDYSANTTSIATSPVIDCSNFTSVKIELKYWLNVEEYRFDQAYIEVYDGSSWVVIYSNPTSDLQMNNWRTFSYDVSSYADGNSNFRIRIRLISDGGKEFSGWNIDNIVVRGEGYCEFFADDFEGYSTGDLSDTDDGSKQWLQRTDVVSDNVWTIATGQGALNGSKGLSISYNNNYASYDNTDDADIIAYFHDYIDARNYKNIKLDLTWKCDGETGNDYGKIVYSTNGNILYEVGNELSAQSTAQSSTIDLSATDTKRFYLGMRWVNDGNSTGNNPAFTVDDISLKGQPYMNYGFYSGTVVYESISGTILNFDANGGSNVSLPIDFDFNYMGEIYQNIRVSKYGWIHFYNNTPDITLSATTNDLHSDSYKTLIAPLWDNLSMDGQSAVIYKIEGNSPNRVVIIEYRDMLWGGARATFQVKLYETTHVIEFIYGNIQQPTGATASIGINGLCHTVFMSIMPGETPVYATDIPFNTINDATYLAEGTIYTFSPYALQPYNTMQGASILIGQLAWDETSTDISTEYYGRRRTPGASSSAVSSKNVLVVGSVTSNRILLWHQIPSENSAPADIVLGQTDFTSSSSGTANDKFDGITALAFSPDGEKLIAADGGNNRVLIWNSIPTSNGAPADVVIGQTDFTSNASGTSASELSYPTGVYVTISGKLIITDHDNNRVLIFNKIPTTNGASADIVIGQSSFNTRSRGSAANQMYYPWDAGVSPDGKLLVSDDGNNRVLVFNKMPTTNGASADYVIGQPDFGSSSSGVADDKFDQPNVTVSPEGKLACGDWGNNRVLLFNRVPTESGAKADAVLGQDDFNENFKYSTGTADGTPDSTNMYYPYSVNFDLNGRLLVNGRYMNRVMLFGEPPTDTSDLAINISASYAGSAICIGTPYTMVITITNNGPDMAKSVVAKASLPANFEYVSSYFTAGSYNSLSGFWTIPAVPVGESYKLTIKGYVNTNTGLGDLMVAYANITSTLEIDDDFSNNSDNIQINVISNHAPTLTTANLTDTVISIGESTGARSFDITDSDGDEISLSYESTNTSLVPNDDAHIVISPIASGSSDINVIPVNDKYGYATIKLIAKDAYGCQVDHEFDLSVGNLWEGDDLTDNTDWHIAQNWAGGVPNSSLEAIIPQHPTGGANFPKINGNASVKNLIIEPGANLTLNDGYTLEVYGDITIKSNSLTTGSFVDLNTQDNLDAGKGLNMASSAGITVERFVRAKSWHYLAMPLDNVSSDVFTNKYYSPYFNGNFYYYDETNLDADWKLGWTQAFNPDHTPIQLDVARGYAFMPGDNDLNVEIQGGELNTGDISIYVTHTSGSAAGTAKEGWNLIGNPYPSGVNADEFIDLNATTNDVIDGTLYFWDEPGTGGFGDNSSLYAYYNSLGFLGSGSGSVLPDKYISSGQGFFVHVSSEGGGNVIFKNSMRETENSFFFKKKNKKVTKIKLAVKFPNNKYNELLVALTDDATENFDSKYDAFKLRDIQVNNRYAFYSLMNDKEMAIQAVPLIADHDKSTIIKLGYETAVDGIHYIYAKDLQNPDNIPIFLYDRKEDNFIDLILTKKYSFYSSKGIFNDRFILVFGEKVLQVENVSSNKHCTEIYNYNRRISVLQTGEFLAGKMYIIDLLGRTRKEYSIRDVRVNSFDLDFDIETGIYIVKVVFDSDVKTSKLFIR